MAWALRSYGGFAMVLPVALLAPLVRARERRVRAAALALAAWSTLLGGLAVAQARFGNEFAPFASVGFALALAGLAGLLAHLMPSRAALAATLAVAGVLVTPVFAMEHLPTTSRTLAHLSQRNDAFRWLASDRRIAMETARVAGDHSLTRFARMVRRYTPETSGYLDARGRPEYGVLCLPRYGHDVHYWARRATPANNFGPYLDTPKYLASLRFFRAQTESEAVAIAASLGVRYVLSSDRAGEEQGYVDRVHAVHAPGRPSPPSPERLRLVVEGPAGGRPLLVDYLAPYPSGRVPFRLFELVEGAILEAEAPPGTPVVAETTVRPNLGRRFAYRR